jgi:hypothetical protein
MMRTESKDTKLQISFRTLAMTVFLVLHRMPDSRTCQLDGSKPIKAVRDKRRAPGHPPGCTAVAREYSGPNAYIVGPRALQVQWNMSSKIEIVTSETSVSTATSTTTANIFARRFAYQPGY